MNQLRIIFLGTSDFAVSSLEILINNGFNIVAVVTAPDKAQGRGLKVNPSPIKEFALNHNLPILQPENLKNEEFLTKLSSYNANLQVVVAFRMLPKEVWGMPKLGTINLHASVLPQYRGAAPINWAIINGETETGVTTFFIDDKMDTGNIAFIDKESIFLKDTFKTLYERLKFKGANLLLKTVKAIEKDECPRQKQLTTTYELKKAPKISKEDCQIDWNNSSQYIYNFVRGMSPIPTAWMEISNKKYKILDVDIYLEENNLKLKPGQVFYDKTKILIGTKNNPISLKKIQPEGKRLMTVKEFLAGNII